MRYYEERGLLESTRTANGYRSYAHDAVVRVQQIRALLLAGFHSDVIAQLLPCAVGPAPTITLCPQIAASMRAVLRTVETQLDELERQRRSITALLD